MWFHNGEGKDLADTVPIGDRTHRADHISFVEHRFAAMTAGLAVGLNGDIGADSWQLTSLGSLRRCQCRVAADDFPSKLAGIGKTKRPDAVAGNSDLLCRQPAEGGVFVWRGWYSIDGVESSVVKQLAAQDRETTVAEDIGLVGSVQRGLKSRGYKPGPLVIDPNYGANSEHPIAVLQTWMREGVGESHA